MHASCLDTLSIFYSSRFPPLILFHKQRLKVCYALENMRSTPLSKARTNNFAFSHTLVSETKCRDQSQKRTKMTNASCLSFSIFICLIFFLSFFTQTKASGLSDIRKCKVLFHWPERLTIYFAFIVK